MSDLDIIRRIAERGLKLSQGKMDDYVDVFQHLLDELGRLPNFVKREEILKARFKEVETKLLGRIEELEREAAFNFEQYQNLGAELVKVISNTRMTPTEYMALALRTAPDDLKSRNLLHASMGMAGEAGEVLDMVKKIEFYGKPVDRTKLLEETSDIFWYCNLLIYTLGSTWEEVFEINIAKLETRYPDLRFCADRAINRDVEAEQQAIASL